MNAVKHALCNTQLGPPAGVSESECRTLPIRRDETGMTSYWKPTRMEMVVLNAGGAVALKVCGGGHPPVSMAVALPEAAIPDPEVMQACLRRMVQLMWSPMYEKETVKGCRKLLAAEFEPEVIQQAFAAVGFGREVPEEKVEPFKPEDPDAGTPFAIMDAVSNHTFYAMGLCGKPDVTELEGLSLAELAKAAEDARELRRQMPKGQIQVLPDERLVAAVFTLVHSKILADGAEQEVIVNDGEHALVVVKCRQPGAASAE
jgi:hypothetical protein